MKINNDMATYMAPYTIMIVDAFDAYYYADIILGKESKIFAHVDTIELAKTLADALFITKNFMWDSLDEMNSLDAGYDVRVYDANKSCVHAAHITFKEQWIPNAHGMNYEFWHGEN